jgi:hypothetical protein
MLLHVQFPTFVPCLLYLTLSVSSKYILCLLLFITISSYPHTECGNRALISCVLRCSVGFVVLILSLRSALVYVCSVSM